MRKWLIPVLVIMLVSAADAATRQRFYGSVDIGFALPEDIDIRAKDSDVPTNCDQHFSPVTVGGVQLPLPLGDTGCARGQDTWKNGFDLQNGLMGGVAYGYAGKVFRFEAEYFYRAHSGEYSPLQIQTGGKNDEFVVTGESMSDFRAHQLFFNVYYDFQNVAGRVLPYLGAGLGRMIVKMNYSAKFLRNADRDVIEGLGRHPEAAGTLTFSDDELSGTLWSYQVMAGLDYMLTRNISVGMKARYVAVFGDNFQDGHPWDRLRSHASTIAPGGDSVAYKVELENGLDMWGVSLNVKYFF